MIRLLQKLLLTLGVASLLAIALPVTAREAPEASYDPVLEKRLLALSEQLRCLVCQNQNIADSNAELAQDLRLEVRKMLVAGKSDQEIIDFLVARYGDFVLYRPPVKSTTWLLWAGPGVLLLLGVFGLIRHLRTRNQLLKDSDRPLSSEEARRAEALLQNFDRDAASGNHSATTAQEPRA